MTFGETVRLDRLQIGPGRGGLVSRSTRCFWEGSTRNWRLALSRVVGVLVDGCTTIPARGDMGTTGRVWGGRCGDERGSCAGNVKSGWGHVVDGLRSGMKMRREGGQVNRWESPAKYVFKRGRLWVCKIYTYPLVFTPLGFGSPPRLSRVIRNKGNSCSYLLLDPQTCFAKGKRF